MSDHEGNGQIVESQESGNRPVAENPDPFDPERLRLSQDFSDSVGVKKVILSVPLRKPAKEWFVRVHPSSDYRLQTAVIELKEERQTYLVAPEMLDEVVGESTFGPRMLFTAINAQKVLFIWPVRLPGIDGKLDEWSRTALEAAERATKKWVRIAANMSAGFYEVWDATGELPEPEWPDKSFRDLLAIAFKGRVIDSPDHPVLQRLRGETV